MTKKLLSNIKNSAILTALLSTAGVAHATNNHNNQQPINVSGPETEVIVSPTINANPTNTNNLAANSTSQAGAQAGAHANNQTHVQTGAHANGGNLEGEVTGTVTGTIQDNSQTLNNAGGAEVEVGVDNNLNLSNGGVNGTISDQSTTYNNAGGAESENTLNADLSNGGVTADLSNGGVTDNSQTAIDASSSNQNDLAQNNEQTNEQEQNNEQTNEQEQNNEQAQENNQDQTNEQSTSVDTSGSGNSENQNTQNTEVGGNNSSYTNNSTYKSGAAANIPQAAAIFATKSCVSSTSIGIGGGNVYAGYGGLSFSHVGSEAVSLTGKVTIEGKEVDVAYTIPELAGLTPAERAPIFDDLRSGEQELATCLMGNYQGKENALEKAYAQAERVATINADAHTTGKAIDAQASTYIAEVQAKGAVDVEKTKALGKAFNQTVTHSCNLGVTVVNAGKDKQEVVKGTLAIRDQGHENCEEVMWGTFNALTEGEVKTTKPNFSQYTKSVAPALKR